LYTRSNSANYRLHRNALTNLLIHHIYNVQNFEKKKKLLFIVNMRIKFMDFINYFNKKKFSKVFMLFLELIRLSVIQFIFLFIKQIFKSINARLNY